MPSFDIVSRIDLAEVDNAIAGIKREITTRFDFKGSKCVIERAEGEIRLTADDDLKLIRWSDEKIDGLAHIPWRPFEHPQLGNIEIGGWNRFHAFVNPPPKVLERSSPSGWRHCDW